ncbi:diadenosine tetraphosphate hydrolase [Flavobacteriaceae bacterium CRH]|nr:diadenosine tetraphosphate hydrolase [Flavobacteriaceae bacterium CRH]
MTDFSNIDYLNNGNEKQILAFEVLTQNKILFYLSEFEPVLVGTIPINIDIENSDLDIICYWKNKTSFTEKLKTIFGNKNDFEIRETLIDNEETIIANFKIDNFEIEVFGQNIPTMNQNGYKHMLIEYKILKTKDENFRLEIIKLKQNGYKTEPAFAFLLGLKGNPYVELLHYDCAF